MAPTAEKALRPAFQAATSHRMLRARRFARRTGRAKTRSRKPAIAKMGTSLWSMSQRCQGRPLKDSSQGESCGGVRLVPDAPATTPGRVLEGTEK